MSAWILFLAFLPGPSQAELTKPELATAARTRVGELFRIDQMPGVLKSQAELDRYFQCHIGTGQQTAARAEALRRYGDFKAKTQNYIKWAAKEFGMPSALAQCIMFRESFFDNSLESPKGAVSMAQIMETTYGRVLDRIIKDSDTAAYEGEYNDYLKLGIDPLGITPETNSTDNPLVKWQQFANKKGPYYDQASETERETSHKLAIDELAKFESGKKLQASFYSYLRTAHANLPSADKKKYFPNSSSTKLNYSDQLPSRDKATLVKNPVVMAGVQMYLLSEMMLRMDYRLSSKMKSSNDPLTLMAMIAGGYNAGDEAMLSALEGATTPVEWCENLRKKGGEETSNYMLSVRRCLMRGDNKQPTGNDPSDKCDSGFFALGDDPCVPQRPTRPKARPEKKN